MSENQGKSYPSPQESSAPVKLFKIFYDDLIRPNYNLANLCYNHNSEEKKESQPQREKKSQKTCFC